MSNEFNVHFEHLKNFLSDFADCKVNQHAHACNSIFDSFDADVVKATDWNSDENSFEKEKPFECISYPIAKKIAPSRSIQQHV